MRVKGPIQTPDGQLIVGLSSNDGPRSFSAVSKLTFNPAYFYLSQDSQSKPMVNLGGFSGAMVIQSAPITLSSGAGAATGNWSVDGGYDYGGWFNSGSPTILTVPTGVSLITISGRALYTVTGTPANTGYMTQEFTINGASLTPPLRTRYPIINAASIDEPIVTMQTHPIKVKPGDTINFQYQTTFATATNVTVTGTLAVQALNV